MHLTNYKNFLNTQCANCSLFLTSENIKLTNIKPENCANRSSFGFLPREVSNTEAITYIYGVSKRYLIGKLKSFYIELNYDCSISDLCESSDDTVLVLCENCISVFEELYKFSKSFRNLSDKNSLIWKILEDKGFEVNVEETEIDFDIKQEDIGRNDLANSSKNWTLEHWTPEEINDEDVKPEAEILIEGDNCVESENYEKDPSGDNIATKRKILVTDVFSPSNIKTRLRGRKHFKSSKDIDPVEIFSDEENEDALEVGNADTDNSESENEHFSDGTTFSKISSQTPEQSDEEFLTITGTGQKRKKTLGNKYPNRRSLKEYYEKIKWQENSSFKNVKYKYKCKECATVFLSLSQFQLHYLNAHFEGSSTYSGLIPGPPYECPKCGTIFKAFTGLLRHCARLHDLKIYKKGQGSENFLHCKLCDASCAGSKGLALHLRQQHSNDKDPLETDENTPEIAEEKFDVTEDTFEITEGKKPAEDEKVDSELGDNDLLDTEFTANASEVSEEPDEEYLDSNQGKKRKPRKRKILVSKYSTRRNLKKYYEKIVCQEKSSSKNFKYKYKCKECNKEVHTLPSFQIHYLNYHFKGFSTHPGKITGPPFKCPKCEANFNQFLGILRHCARFHNLKVYNNPQVLENLVQCKLCDACFDSPKQLTNHRKEKHQNDNYPDKKAQAKEYEVLGVKYPKRLNLKEYYEKIVWPENSTSKNIKYSYKCKECDEEFITISQFQRHYLYNHFKGSSTELEIIKGPPFKCPKCKIVLKQFEPLLVHCARFHDLKIYQQDNVHDKLLQCKLCDAYSKDSNGLAEHQRQQHPNDKDSLETDEHTLEVAEKKFDVAEDTFKKVERKKPAEDEEVDSEVDNNNLLDIEFTGNISEVSERRKEKYLDNNQSKICKPRKNKILGTKYTNRRNLKKYYDKIVCQEKSSAKNVKKYKYKCKECDKEVHTLSSFQIHYLSFHFEGSSTHPGKITGPPFKCPKCETNFNNFLGILRHCARFHNLKVHNNRQVLGNLVQCKLCDAYFDTLKHLAEHRKEEHQNDKNLLDVDPPNASEKSEQIYEEHPTDNYQDKKAQAKENEVLGVKYPKRLNLKQYYEKIRWQENPPSKNVKNSFKCKECGKEFLTISQFQRHYLKHHFKGSSIEPEKIKGPPFKCPKCKIVLKQFEPLLVHCARFHDINVYQIDKVEHTFLQCKLCEASFGDSNELAEHQKLFHGMDYIESGAKGVVEKQRIGLRKIHKCRFCDEYFEKYPEMVKHRSSHPKEEQIYRCSQCPRTFTTYNDWHYHDFRHRDTEKHLCETCGKSITGAKAYRAHCRDHEERNSGVRAICELCGKSFVTKKMLVKHKYIMHDRREQKTCHLCGHVSATGYNLKLHLKVHEKNGILRRRKNTQTSS